MKCQVNSRTSHGVLISKEISYKSYKEICSGEKKKVNLGHWGNWDDWKVENNSMVHLEKPIKQKVFGTYSTMSFDWEVLSKFFSIHNIEPNWLDCNYTTGWYDEELGRWTGCLGKVLATVH